MALPAFAQQADRVKAAFADLKKAEDDMKIFAQQNKAIQVDAQAKASIEGVAKLKAGQAASSISGRR